MTLRCANCGIADDDVLLAAPNPVPLHPGGDKGCRDAALRLLEESRIAVEYLAMDPHSAKTASQKRARALLAAYPKESQ